MSSIVLLSKPFFVIIISQRLFPFCGGFNDTYGMSFSATETDLYCWISMVAIFWSSSYVPPIFTSYFTCRFSVLICYSAEYFGAVFDFFYFICFFLV